MDERHDAGGPGRGTARLQCTDATKRFGGEPVLERVSLQVRGGEIHALVGLNGAGKTTLMRLLLGMVRPDGGSVLVGGREPSALSAPERAGVGYLIEHPLAYPELTVLQNLQVAGRLAGLEPGRARTAARDLIEEFALTKWAGTQCRRLSLGNKQRLGLAAALTASPGIILLDEPTNALDPAGVMIVRRMLLDRAHARGAAVLVSSHHLDEVARVADRISVLNAGRIIGNLAPEAIDLERRFFQLIYADSGIQQ
ncbi:ABC transporter ATP-binding protein [Arthrobacter sp. TMN-37]